MEVYCRQLCLWQKKPHIIFWFAKPLWCLVSSLFSYIFMKTPYNEDWTYPSSLKVSLFPLLSLFLALSNINLLPHLCRATSDLFSVCIHYLPFLESYLARSTQYTLFFQSPFCLISNNYLFCYFNGWFDVYSNISFKLFYITSDVV
jgi:hypothetical protein